jgi:AMP-binding enzyme/Phosphopantetheine attachment site/AMP-binding enzyme C-terminal domain
VGQVGEIVVKGHHFALGYWRQPELTGTVFHPDPHASGARFYHTGDLGRRRPDGSLEHLGRKGGRVKIRGYSVEVAEVEAALQALDQVHAAAVMVREDGAGDQRLVAYVVPTGQPLPTVTTLRHSLAATLADYMIPATFMLLDALPLAASGKVDRQALPIPPPTRPALQAPFVLPSTPVETTLAAIWAEVLGLDQVGLHDHFLELGGNSLLATQVVARVHATWQVAVPLQTLLETPTVAHMAVCITQHLATGMTRTDLVHLLAAVEGLSEDAARAPRTPPTPG